MTAPFERGSISIRLYPHNELAAPDIVTELCAQAGLALDGGFDGVMTSEHHGGVGGYLPNPLQMASFVLTLSDRGWAAPCPLLLPLRPTALVAEEIAWLDARYPGRVGLGVGSGAMALDFTVMGLDVADAATMFKAELPRVVAMLRGEELDGLEKDRALERCRISPIPVLSAAVSVTAARRAARVGAGLILEGMSDRAKLTSLCAAFDEAGGTVPKVLIRRVWLGQPLAEIIAAQRQFYERAGRGTGAFGEDQTVITTDPAAMADQLVDVLTATGADALNLRVHLPGIPAEAIREQVMALATDVLPRMRATIGAGPVPT